MESTGKSVLLRILALAFALFAAPVLAGNAPSTVDVLRSLHLDPGFRKDLRDRGYTDERFEVMVEHTRLLYADAAIIGGLERQIAAILERNNYQVSQKVGITLDAMLAQAYQQGVARLTSNERVQLFSVDAGFLRAIPSKDCNRLLGGKMAPERWSTLLDAYMVQLSPATLQSYHAATRSAMRQGLNGARRAAELTSADVRAVEEAIFPEIDRIIGAQKHADKLYDAWSNPGKAGRYACSFNQIFNAAALNLKGSTRDRAILYLMTQ